jgi:ATP-dependent DNA helicase RecG
MNKDEVLHQLSKYEWNDVEFKEARNAVPRNSYETVSAFANTGGGWLVFGVSESDNHFEIVGVVDVDKVQNDILSTLRSRQKLNRMIDVQEDLLEHDEKVLLVFYIPESPRSEKPIYLDGTLARSFIRQGGCDFKCSENELKRLIRDASNETYDKGIVEVSVDSAFDENTLNWYRNVFKRNDPGLSNLEFLLEWGFLAEVEAKLLPTRASILLFGKERYVRQVLPRLVLDYQRIDRVKENWSEKIRWNDRVEFEENLFEVWKKLQGKFAFLVDTSFSISADTLRRDDDPEEYITFREAVINLLTHQDYGDHNRKPVIQFFLDEKIYWNPGDAFSTTEELLDSGEKEVRNPLIVNAFRRIGLSEQAGTGIRTIYRNWRDLGYLPPQMVNDKSRKSFQITMASIPLMTEQQVILNAQLGVNLSGHEADVFAYGTQKVTFTFFNVKQITGCTDAQCKGIISNLLTQVLITELDENTYTLAEHLRSHFLSDQASDQVEGSLVTETIDQAVKIPEKINKLNDKQKKIIVLCEVPRTAVNLRKEMGMKNPTYFRRAYVQPLLDMNLIKYTHPEILRHPEQAYIITEQGLRLLSIYRSQQESV